MGVVNRRCNELKNERTARFGFIECAEDPETCRALLGFVEDWARRLGMNKLVGPMGFSEQDPEGLLVEGFDQEPTLVAFHNFPFLPRLVEECGYTKELDFVEYLVPLGDGVPALYEKIAARVARQTEFRLLEFARTKQLKPYIHRIFELMNSTFVNIYGYVSMDEQEIDTLARQYLPIVDPRFVKLAVREEEVLGFIIGMPNMNPGLRQCKGHVFPFGVLLILAAMKKAKRLDLFLGGIREDFRGRGIDVMLGAAIMRSAIEAGFTGIDSHREMETNLKMRAEMERVGGQVIKRFRVFQKPL
jgi:GNAT superfamily N-acetyltransferase